MMAELYVRVVDKVNPDSPYLDLDCSKRGDVIVVCPDKWQWGKEELNSPDHVILKIPSMTLDEAQALTAHEPGFGAFPQKSRVLRKRAFKLDLDDPSLPANLKDAVDVALPRPPLVLVHETTLDQAAAVAADATLKETTKDSKTTVSASLPVGRDAHDQPIVKDVPVVVVALDLDAVRALKVAKPPAEDPTIIGPDPLVIG